MSQPDRPFLADLKIEVSSLVGEMREMVVLRYELLRQEALSDLQNTRRLLIVTAISGMLVLSALPLVVVAFADVLNGVWGLARWAWLVIFAGIFLLAAVLAVIFAWRRFRRRFIGLRETLEELQEDWVWLQEWTKKK
jgi:peptidoglycan biosynthesis protein MviN/MurJ (putative lipid II flippase)